MEPLATDDPGQIGEYRLLRRLGAGGMGRVYLGRTAGGRTVAVKAVRGELADDAEFRARFRQEVAAARLVGGQWTAPVLDADTEGPLPWVATGYVAGPALGAAVREFGPLPVPVVHALGAGLAEALVHLHGLGLVHRDIKPSNVLLALDGPRLIDFGIARALDAATALTQSGYVVGSPGFMSPEQAEGAPAGPASDVFSLGAVLAYAATGVAPFGEGVSAAVLLYRVLHEEPDLAGLDGPLGELVRHCLAKAAGDRPAPEQLLAVLRGAPGRGWLPPEMAAAVAQRAVDLLDLDGTPAAAPARPPVDRTPTEVVAPAVPKRRRRWWPPAAAAVAVAALAGGGLWLWGPDSGSRGGSDGRTQAPPEASGDVPEAYLGTWEGTITTQIVPLGSTFRVEFTAGKVGEVVGRTSNASRLSSTVCRGELTLLTVDSDSVELQERPVGDNPACTGVPERQTYSLKNGTLHLQVSGAAMGSDPAGDLTKQG
ncbi:hypothetical protein GCM10010193_42600 [Kitasatospora atroaurantiaca]|uniref:Serine/threonine protein kinase n=1 Tax=Kitasatospora atroaurantiaca TaxID=285545 RepID=A0A561ETY1_9ACTN|nr:serine/threonine-protein kinase [Kitasatospora atroaurantiaca]TWE19069.1 serine/threonine protein kinase [Kitasatospora atroaurantiaca]